MDPSLINESSFSAANPSSYSLAEIWPFPISPANGPLRMPNSSFSESTVTEQSGARKRTDFTSEEEEDDTSNLVSTSTNNHFLNDSNGKRMKVSGSRNENGGVKHEVEASSVAGNNKPTEQSSKPEPPKDYIHVRARRGQATDSHSLAERARREKISGRMKLLQDLVPGCNKVIGKALVLDEIINYIQSLQRQVEFLSMKLETVNSRKSMTSTIGGYHSKESLDATRMLFGSQAPREYAQESQAEWLHMQIGGSLERST